MHLLRRILRNPDASPQTIPSLNNYYLTSAPSPQHAVDIFKGDWSSKFPPPLEQLTAGFANLFEDPRINWFCSELGDLNGKQILELGPLEGGHSYMLEQHGAETVIAVEANTHAYLKCLVAKELLGMQHVKFLCGDFIEYLRKPACPKFDIGLASGVLYHMENPVELISLLAKTCRSHLLIWTHYYDRAWAEGQANQDRFSSTHSASFAGFSHTLARQKYHGDALNWAGFCGGSQPFSNWMLRDEIIRCLAFFGFPNVKINFDEYNHPNGPAFALIASRA